MGVDVVNQVLGLDCAKGPIAFLYVPRTVNGLTNVAITRAGDAVRGCRDAAGGKGRGAVSDKHHHCPDGISRGVSGKPRPRNR